MGAGELAHKEGDAADAAKLADAHAEQFLPFTTAYQQAEALGVEDDRIKAINAAQAGYEAALKAKGKGYATIEPLR